MRQARLRTAAVIRALVTTSALVLGGCSSGAGRPEWPPSPAVIDVRMNEYTFSLPPAIPAGRVVFQARNVGSLGHELQLFALAEDIPPIDAQIRGSQRRVLNAVAGVPRREPAAVGVFSVDLVVGQRYAMICLLRVGGKSHATEGMSSEFRAIG